MAFTRTRSRFSSSSPMAATPPSPIPTATGSRSAANSIFSDFLNRTIKIPELSLPESVHRHVPADIDRRSIANREGTSVKRLLKSASDFGVFTITGHEINVDELRSTVAGLHLVLQNIPDDWDHRQHRYCEEFFWPHFQKLVKERADKLVGAQEFWSFRDKMESANSKLEAIAKELTRVISESANKNLNHMAIQPKQSVLSLYRYHQKNVPWGGPPPFNHKNRDSCYQHALSLHLPLDNCEFHVQSDRGPFSFTTDTDAIVVTVGKQLQDWSLGEFKPAHGEITFEENLSSNGQKFSILLRSSPSNFNHGLGRVSKSISVSDQIFFVIILWFLYKILLGLSGYISYEIIRRNLRFW